MPIVRTPGSNEFAITVTSGEQGENEYALTQEGFERLVTFDPDVCQVTGTNTFQGTGELQA